MWCLWCGLWCRCAWLCVCRVVWHAENPVCRFKTPPCVHSKRPRVIRPVATCYVSLQRPGNFTHFLREDGPRILIRRSIPTGWFCRLRCNSWCISCTSCSRPSLCNDRCRFWSGQCSAFPVETPQAQFLDEVIVIMTSFMVQTVQFVWRYLSCSSSSRTLTSLVVALGQIPVVLVRFHSCRALGGSCPCRVLQLLCRGAEAFSQGPDGSSDHRDSHLLLNTVIDVPGMQVVQVQPRSFARCVQRQVPSRSCSSSTWSSTPTSRCRGLPMVQTACRTRVILRLLDTVVDAPVTQNVQFPVIRGLLPWSGLFV